VLGAARHEAWDRVLPERDAVWLYGRDDALVAVAVERLGALGVNAHAASHLPAAPLRWLAAAGLVIPGSARALRSTVELAA
jgi:hypothetical protein